MAEGKWKLQKRKVEKHTYETGIARLDRMEQLCDENGELLFDPFNVDDLNAITKLDNQVLIDFNNGLGDSKNSPTADASG